MQLLAKLCTGQSISVLGRRGIGGDGVLGDVDGHEGVDMSVAEAWIGHC